MNEHAYLFMSSAQYTQPVTEFYTVSTLAVNTCQRLWCLERGHVFSLMLLSTTWGHNVALYCEHDCLCYMWNVSDSHSLCLCMFMCVRLFSELSHRSLRCLAGFYADGLINGWEMLVLHYGYSPFCNSRHDPPDTHRANRKRKNTSLTIILPCKWQLSKQVKSEGKQNIIKLQTQWA